MATEEEDLKKLTEKYYNDWKTVNDSNKSQHVLPKFYQAVSLIVILF